MLSFRTRHSGTISVQATAAGPRSQLRLSLPVIPADDPVPPGCDVASPLLQALLGPSQDWLHDVRYSARLQDLLVVLKPNVTAEDLAALSVRPQALLDAYQGDQLKAIFVTTQGTSKASAHDCHSRFFGPWIGIDEDSATGSAHAMAAPYWAEALGKTRLRAQQCSKRGGDFLIDVDKDADAVHITGSTAIISRGHLYV